MLKYCSQCGNKLNEGEKFCSNCGHKVIDSEPTFNDASNDVTTQFNKSNDNVPPPPPPFNKAKDDVPPPPSSSNNAYSKEEPYNEPSFNNTPPNVNNNTINPPPNVNPNKNNNSTYNKNVVQAKTSSNTKFIAIASIIVATLIILSVGGYLYFKWKNIKENTSSAQSSSITNTDSKNSSNNAANNGTANNNNNNNSANNNVSDVSNKNKDNTSSNNLLSDDMIKDYIALADSTSLNLFKLASEAEQNGQAKQSFASIRPLLQNCYSDAIVDGELKPFYESELGQWTYELGMAFPFYSKAYFDQCTFTVTQRTESIVQVKIIDNNPEPLVSSTYTLKRYDKIWKIENVQIITND